MIKTLRRDISILFIVCFIVIILLDFWLKEVPEWFSGGAKIGELVYRICLAYITSFIFYFLVVHIKTQKDKEAINTYVSKKVYMIIAICWGTFKEMAAEAGITLSGNYPTKQEIAGICAQIRPTSQSPIIDQNLADVNWLKYLNYKKNKSEKIIEKIYRKMPFLDSSLVRLLAAIEECRLFQRITHFDQFSISTKDFDPFKDAFSEYINLIIQLEVYADKKLKVYRPDPK